MARKIKSRPYQGDHASPFEKQLAMIVDDLYIAKDQGMINMSILA